MKILAGIYKNRQLKTPKGEKTRPTASKVRGSVFDILQNQIQNTRFLDVFAGSGSMGIEALSRGAREATFIEKERSSAACIRANLEDLGLEAKVYQKDAKIILKRLAKQKMQFEIIYMDPPYALNIETFLELIPPLLAPDGILIVEQSKRTPSELPLFEKIKEKRIGDTILYFCKIKTAS